MLRVAFGLVAPPAVPVELLQWILEGLVGQGHGVLGGVETRDGKGGVVVCFWHYGAVFGADEVHHFCAEEGEAGFVDDKRGARFAKTSWAAFAQGGRVDFVPVSPSGARSPAEARAVSERMQSVSAAGSAPYHLMAFNCEHVSRFVVEGHQESLQVRDLQETIVRRVVASIAAAPAAAKVAAAALIAALVVRGLVSGR
jgi:hypothetical protein